MHYLADTTLDDLLRRTFLGIQEHGVKGVGQRGAYQEVTGVLVHLKNPLARLSATESRNKFFSPIGELLWYLSGSDDVNFIRYYAADYINEIEPESDIVHGAYGPRLFYGDGQSQLDNVYNLLKRNPQSKRAVVQLFDRADIEGGSPFKNIPCTLSLQFLLRDKKLHLVVYMRSSDAYIGLPHDIFAFTFIQEMIARRLGAEIGEYKQMTGSLHLYERDLKSVKNYLDEGWQEAWEMPSMPSEGLEENLFKLLEVECSLRSGESLSDDRRQFAPYWADLALTLQWFRHYKDGKLNLLPDIEDQLNFRQLVDHLVDKRTNGGAA